MSKVKPTIAELLKQPHWHAERKALRAILVDSPLSEEVKWGKLCYTFEGSNVAIFYGLKDYCGVGFFKGALMKDPKKVLHRQGEHSQAVRLIRFTSAAQIEELAPVVRAYIQQAVEIEKAGLKIDFKEKNELVFPDELNAKMKADKAFKAAFLALTPGRQRGYVLSISAAKQAATRVARVEKFVPRILAGKGMNDR